MRPAMVGSVRQVHLMSVSRPCLMMQPKRLISKGVNGADWYYGYCSFYDTSDSEIMRLKTLIAECNNALAHCHDTMPDTIEGVIEVNNKYAALTKNLNNYKSQLTAAIAMDDKTSQKN